MRDPLPTQNKHDDVLIHGQYRRKSTILQLHGIAMEGKTFGATVPTGGLHSILRFISC